MKRKRLLWFLSPLLILALLIPGIPASADVPGMPHAFYGTLIIGGSSAPEGTVVTAKVSGTQVGSITTTVSGQYGALGLHPKLVVQDDIATGATIDFYVGGTLAVDTWVSGDPKTFTEGGVTELNLIVGEAPPPTFTAEAGGPYSGIVGESIALSGSASGGTSPYTYAWDLDNDGQYDDSTAQNPSYTWSTASSYTIGLQVTDSASPAATATDTATVTVTVTEVGAFDPYIYDTDGDGVISYSEAMNAVNDYAGGTGSISKADVLKVIKLYFS